MKKYTPFIFPLIVIAIVFFLVFRWYNLRTSDVDVSSQIGEGVEIENLSEQEMSDFSSATDVTTVNLESAEPAEGEVPSSGVIRYEEQDNRVRFSVIANVPEVEGTTYTVWLHDEETGALQQAFSLTPGKGGMMGSAAVSADLLPFEVVVSTATSEEMVMDSVILRGKIEPEENQESVDESMDSQSEEQSSQEAN